jgi:hypothetical protein
MENDEFHLRYVHRLHIIYRYECICLRFACMRGIHICLPACMSSMFLKSHANKN